MSASWYKKWFAGLGALLAILAAVVVSHVLNPWLTVRQAAIALLAFSLVAVVVAALVVIVLFVRVWGESR